MNYYLIFSIILLCCISIIIILALRNHKSLTKQITKLENLEKEQLKEYFKEEWKVEQDKLKLKRDGLEKEWQSAAQKHHMQLSTLDNEIKKYEAILTEKEKRYKEVNQDLDLYRSGKIKEIDKAAAEYKKHKQLLVDNGIKEYREFTNKFFNAELWNQKEQLDYLKEQKQHALDDLDAVRYVLEEERRKREAINEEIRRQRAVEEEQDFYRIQINPNDLQDIEILRSITSRLRHPEAINKVIWNGYYQKPLAELRKRVGIEGSGVYKITRLKTGEIYIGQAVNVSTRWAEHCKAALGVGTLASSQLHRVMAEDGCENFTFELLEEVEKDKLRERESFYIDFYDSKNYGLNTLSGDKNK